MIEINSYIKNGDSFILAESYQGPIKNPLYIDGSIELIIGKAVLMDKTLWDDLNHLWCYLVQGMVAVMDGKEYSTYFPDQPTQIKLLPDLADRTVTVMVKVKEPITAQAPLDEFASAFVHAGRKFFMTLFRLLPQSESETYRLRLQQLDKIEQKIAKRSIQ